MTYYELIISLWQRLLDAERDGSRKLGEELFSTLNMMCGISYEKQNEALTNVITDLMDSARDVAMGVKGKSEISSMEDIQSVFPPTEKAS
jgi:hypothetical protein